MTAIAFSDPNCPFCYATEERLHSLGLAGRVEWRGVEHAPDLPVPTTTAEPIRSGELDSEVEAIRLRAPEIEIDTPAAKPNTGLAIRYGAAAQRTEPAAGRRFIRSLYRGLWVERLDLADEPTLQQLACAAGLPDIRPAAEDIEIAGTWRREWLRLGATGVPLLIRADGRSLYGLTGADDLNDFLPPG